MLKCSGKVTGQKFVIRSLIIKCVVPCPPKERLMEVPRGRGVLKAQFFKGKYGTKMEFPEGVGASS